MTRRRRWVVVATVPLALFIAASCASSSPKPNPDPGQETTLRPRGSSERLAILEPSSANAPSGSVPSAPGTPPTGLHAVDWKNREYVAGLVRLKDGRGELHEYSEEFGGMHDTTLWELQTVAFGDVDGDGLDEALVLIQETYYAPSGPGSERLNVYLYRELAGDVVQLGETLSVSKSASAGIERGYIMLSEPEGCTVYRLQANIWTRQTDGCPLK